MNTCAVTYLGHCCQFSATALAKDIILSTTYYKQLTSCTVHVPDTEINFSTLNISGNTKLNSRNRNSNGIHCIKTCVRKCHVPDPLF